MSIVISKILSKVTEIANSSGDGGTTNSFGLQLEDAPLALTYTGTINLGRSITVEAYSTDENVVAEIKKVGSVYILKRREDDTNVCYINVGLNSSNQVIWCGINADSGEIETLGSSNCSNEEWGDGVSITSAQGVLVNEFYVPDGVETGIWRPKLSNSPLLALCCYLLSKISA